MAFDLTILFVLLIAFLIMTAPLYLAVKMFGGQTTLLKTFLVLLITGILVGVISTFFPLGGLIGFIVLIWIYAEMFKIGLFRAFLIWLAQLILIIIINFILLIAGLSVLTLSLFF